jgi:hypothetical protein
MTRLTPADLPAKVRAQLGIDANGRPAAKPRPRPGGRITDGGPCPGRCHTCHQTFPTYTAWERHCDADHAGNARWDIDLVIPTTPTAPGGPHR